MSDFDKEAEREKLREKFAKDREKRQHTQQMSELLLKGATMTNRHCGRCGDPIFRHDGREFCPSCGTGETAEGAQGTTPTDGAADAAADNAADAATNNAADATTNNAAATNNAAVTDRTDADVERAANANAESPVADAADAGAGTDRGGSNDRGPAGSGSPHGEASTGHGPGTAATPADDAPGLEAAQRSLTEAVTTLSRRAADADDPRRAKEYLEAAREAAEALAALR